MKTIKRYTLLLLGMFAICPSFGQTQSNSASVLTLSDCVALAKEHNRTLQNMALDIQMAGEQKKEAFTKFFPQISANVLAFQAFDEIVRNDALIPQEIAILGPQFAPMVGMPIQTRELKRGYSATISLMEPIFTGGQIINGNKLASLQKDVMQLQLQMKEKEIVQKVTENFWQIASVKYNLNTVSAAEKQLDAVYEQVEQFVKAGVTTRNDLLKVKLHQQELASNRLKLENAERILLLLLTQQVGMASTDDGKARCIDIVVPGNEENVVLPLSDGQDASVYNREEYLLANKGVEAEQLQVKMERGKLFPTVAVGVMGYNTGFGGISSNLKNYMDTNMTNGLVLGTVSVPISDWWGGSHAIKRQKLKLEQAKNTAADAKEMLNIDVQSAWSNLVEAYKQIEVAKASVEQSEENLRLSSDSYRAGVETLTDLLDAETLNRKAHNSLSDALASYQIRLADYQRKIK